MCHCELTEWRTLAKSFTNNAELPIDVFENIQRFYGRIAAVLHKSDNPEKSYQQKAMKIILNVLVACYSKIPNGPCFLLNKVIEDVYVELLSYPNNEI